MLPSDTNIGQQGIALLGAMVIVLILSLLATTLLNLAGQEAISANAGNQAAVAQQLADAASELVVAWFHDPRSTAVTPRIASQLEKRNRDAEGAPSFFDPTGRSQFVGTANQPDYLFHAENASENQVFNDPEAGMFRVMQHLGHVEELKVYAPSNPGLLCTVDATIATHTNPPVRQSVSLQLGALDVPPLKAAVQVRKSLGVFRPGSESPVSVHWGDLRVVKTLFYGKAATSPHSVRSLLCRGKDTTRRLNGRIVGCKPG